MTSVPGPHTNRHINNDRWAEGW